MDLISELKVKRWVNLHPLVLMIAATDAETHIGRSLAAKDRRDKYPCRLHGRKYRRNVRCWPYVRNITANKTRVFVTKPSILTGLKF